MPNGMIDILATMTGTEYRAVKARLESEGLWVTHDYHSETVAAERARVIIGEIRAEVRSHMERMS